MGNSEEIEYRNTRVKIEINKLLRQFTLATSDEDLLQSALESICSYSNSSGGFYVAANTGNVEHGKSVVKLGLNSHFRTFQKTADELGSQSGTEVFKKWPSSMGWNNLNAPFEAIDPDVNSEGPSIFCTPVRHANNGQIVGYLGLESTVNPFLGSEIEAILVLLTALDVRLYIAEGSFSSQRVIINRIIHEVNGGLSIVGLQNELLGIGSTDYKNMSDVCARIKQGLSKVDSAVKNLDDLVSVFFPSNESVSSCSSNAALNAALVSIPINSNLRSKIHVSTNLVENDVVDISSLVLYWLYRSALAGWVNPDLWDSEDPIEMFVELKSNSEEREYVDLKLSRDTSSSIDTKWKNLFGAQHGLFDAGLVLMSQATALNYWLTLFGGKLALEEVSGVRIITISVPLAS
jgi:hypothetical protein